MESSLVPQSHVFPRGSITSCQLRQGTEQNLYYWYPRVGRSSFSMVCTAQTSSPSANPSAAPSHLFQQRKGFLTLIYDPLSLGHWPQKQWDSFWRNQFREMAKLGACHAQMQETSGPGKCIRHSESKQYLWSRELPSHMNWVRCCSLWLLASPLPETDLGPCPRGGEQAHPALQQSPSGSSCPGVGQWPAQQHGADICVWAGCQALRGAVSGWALPSQQTGKGTSVTYFLC